MFPPEPQGEPSISFPIKIRVGGVFSDNLYLVAWKSIAKVWKRKQIIFLDLAMSTLMQHITLHVNKILKFGKECFHLAQIWMLQPNSTQSDMIQFILTQFLSSTIVSGVI